MERENVICLQSVRAQHLEFLYPLDLLCASITKEKNCAKNTLKTKAPFAQFLTVEEGSRCCFPNLQVMPVPWSHWLGGSRGRGWGTRVAGEAGLCPGLPPGAAAGSGAGGWLASCAHVAYWGAAVVLL